MFWRIGSSSENCNRDVVQICVGLTQKDKRSPDLQNIFAYTDFVKMIAFTARDGHGYDRKHNERTYP